MESREQVTKDKVVIINNKEGGVRVFRDGPGTTTDLLI